MKSVAPVPDEVVQGLIRSSNTCPVAQLCLGRYLMRTDLQNEEALRLLQAAAKSGLCEANMELGIVLFSN
jgi:hypothetical protein